MSTILIIVGIAALIVSAMYFLSRLQMRGWIHELDKQLHKKLENNNIKNEVK